MVRVKFSVIHGYPMLIDIRYRASLPIGASIYDNDGRPVGTVGQNNQAWVRNDKLEDTLTVQWGNRQSCRLHYHIADEQSHDTIIKTPGECR
ncbi:hypothetical protein FHC49_04320 [Kluyvera sp. EC_51]|nr:FimD/PapC C-terminal domain-containing protein [Kluyvera sp. EC_51]MBW9460614.1 hypothetical protein [Kluyvera sp. EC_51]